MPDLANLGLGNRTGLGLAALRRTSSSRASGGLVCHADNIQHDYSCRVLSIAEVLSRLPARKVKDEQRKNAYPQLREIGGVVPPPLTLDLGRQKAHV